jgi:hypothetical protein
MLRFWYRFAWARPFFIQARLVVCFKKYSLWDEEATAGISLAPVIMTHDNTTVKIWNYTTWKQWNHINDYRCMLWTLDSNYIVAEFGSNPAEVIKHQMGLWSIQGDPRRIMPRWCIAVSSYKRHNVNFNCQHRDSFTQSIPSPSTILNNPPEPSSLVLSSFILVARIGEFITIARWD